MAYVVMFLEDLVGSEAAEAANAWGEDFSRTPMQEIEPGCWAFSPSNDGCASVEVRLLDCIIFRHGAEEVVFKLDTFEFEPS